MRKGMMVGKGKKGYHNVVGKDPKVHSQSAKGIKQPQKIPILNIPKQDKSLDVRDIDRVIENMSISKEEKESLKMLDLSYYESQNQWSADKIGNLNAETHLNRYYDIPKSRAKKIIMDLLNSLEKRTIEKNKLGNFIKKNNDGSFRVIKDGDVIMNKAKTYDEALYWYLVSF